MRRSIRRESDHSSIPCVRSESSGRKEKFERTDVRCYGQRGVAAAGGSAPGRQPVPRLRDARSNPNSHVQNFVAYATKVRHGRRRERMGRDRVAVGEVWRKVKRHEK